MFGVDRRSIVTALPARPARHGARSRPRRPPGRGTGRPGDVQRGDAAEREERATVGPVAAASFPCRPGAPSSAISSARGAHQRHASDCGRRSCRSANCVGHGVRGPKLTMSQRADGDHLRHAARARRASAGPGPADSTPPTRSSASSVVVRSSTPAMQPLPAERLQRPPAAIRWRGRRGPRSRGPSRCSRARVDRGRRHAEHRWRRPAALVASASLRAARAPAMPATAAAALPRIRTGDPVDARDVDHAGTSA